MLWRREIFCLQADKQRIIWAYKILFLDVLFPLNLKKVIFVDSDQIIRADFAELWNMDLQVHFYTYLNYFLVYRAQFEPI